jgi:hypothetical protein
VRERRRAEDWSVLVWAAILLVVIGGVVSLAIDAVEVYRSRHGVAGAAPAPGVRSVIFPLTAPVAGPGGARTVLRAPVGCSARWTASP